MPLPFAIHGSTIECHADHGIELTGDVAPPIHLSTTFISGAEESRGQVYSRLDYVTRQRLEAVIGSVEGGHAMTYSSGQSAATALIHCIKPHRIFVDAGYHGVKMAFKLWSERQAAGLRQIEYLTIEDCQLLYETRANDQSQTSEDHHIDLIWLETPNNPYGTVADIAWFSELASRTGACLTVDSTLSSPIGQRPLEHGAHVVMHSSTKYLSGHSDLVGGVLIVHPSMSESLLPRLRQDRSTDGAVMGNFETWLLLRSMRTLSLRFERQSRTAMVLVHWLEKQRVEGNKVTHIHHPYLSSHPNYVLAKRYLRLPPATFSFELRSESQAVSFARSLLLCSNATSLGGVETLVDWRFLYDKTISPSLLRVSVGVEEPEDIIKDFDQALQKAI